MKKINQLAIILFIAFNFAACNTGNNDKSNLTPEQEIKIVDSVSKENNVKIDKLEKDVDDLQKEVDQLLNEINK